MQKTQGFYHAQNRTNLLHLEKDQIVGEWRDSEYGMYLTFSE